MMIDRLHVKCLEHKITYSILVRTYLPFEHPEVVQQRGSKYQLRGRRESKQRGDKPPYTQTLVNILHLIVMMGQLAAILWHCSPCTHLGSSRLQMKQGQVHGQFC